MSTTTALGRTLHARALSVATAAAVLAAGLLTTVLATPAEAHGSVVDPPSRNYGCLERWRSNHLAPEMKTEDQMCYQAYQANPNTMWNWNGLYRENVRGNHQAAVPDGQLCSGGRTQNGLYASLDAVGPWVAVRKPAKFTLNLRDEAQHGADYLIIYITKNGYDPTKQPMSWGVLQQVVKTGKYAPGLNHTVQVDATGFTGRHVVYTIWQASHLDQPYYICSDVIFE